MWLVVAVLIIPLIYWRAAIDPVLVPRFLILSGLSLCFMVCLIVPTYRPSTSSLCAVAGAPVLTLLLYLGFGALSLVTAVNPAEGVFALARGVLTVTFLAISAIMLMDSRRGLPVLAKVTAMAASIHAIVGICQFYGMAFNEIPGHGIMHSTMANRNLYASGLLLMLPMLLFGVATLHGRWRIVSSCVLGLSLAAIGLTQTRAVWLALIVAIVTAGTLLAANRRTPGHVLARHRWIAIAGTLIACTALWPVSRAVVGDAFDKTNRAVSTSRERLLLWEKTAAMIAEHPVLGVGLGNWRILIPKYGTEGLSSEKGDVHFQRPHNDLLWVLAETGIGGFLAYLGFFAVMVRYCVVIHRDPRATEAAKVLAVAAVAGIAGYLTIAMFSYPLERVVHTIHLTLLCAAVVATYHASGLRPTRPIRGRAVPLVAVVALAGCLALGWIRLNAEVHTKRALAAREDGAWQQVIEEIDRGMVSVASLDPMGTPLSWYRGVALYSLGRQKEALRAFEAAAIDHPYHLHVLNNIGTCHEVLGAHDEALRYYNMALAISSRFEVTVKNIAAVHFGLRRFEEAYRVLRAGRPDRWNADFWEDLLIAERAMRADLAKDAAMRAEAIEQALAPENRGPEHRGVGAPRP